MIYEYAIEPGLVATWSDRKNSRYFAEKFGLGSPRTVSRYPKKWKKYVHKACEALTDKDNTRMTELIELLAESMVKRKNIDWNSDLSWTDSAVKEDQRISFHAILAKSNPSGHPSILVADELDEKTARWNHLRGMKVDRTGKDIAHAVGGLLRAAEKIVFVDPYFDPASLDVVGPCLKTCFEKRTVKSPTLRIFSSSDRDKSPAFAHFDKECRDRLPSTLPEGQELTIRRLQNRQGGETLHNRYILTELGGVHFGNSLVEKIGDTDDLHLLERHQYEERWQQYASGDPAFDCPEDTITITGTRRSP